MLKERSRSGSGVHTLARAVAAAGILATLSGVLAWFMVKSQLAGERIRIPAHGRWLAGRTVQGPLTAFAEAHVIEEMAIEATGGRRYAELGEDDPAAQIAMNATLLRSSLFTSIVAFGVAAAQTAFGGVLLLVGRALSELGRRVP